MKEIIILQKGISEVVVHDDDKTSLEEYTKEISKLLELGNVVILETSTKNIILRPTNIKSILISEINEELPDEKDEEIVEKIEEKHEDIITELDEES